jgi:hypothetical protein
MFFRTSGKTEKRTIFKFTINRNSELTAANSLLKKAVSTQQFKEIFVFILHFVMDSIKIGQQFKILNFV